MLKIYKKASPVILAVILILGVIVYIMFPELFYNNKMSYGACLHAMSSDVIYSIEYDEDSSFAIVTLQDVGGYGEDTLKRKYIVFTMSDNYLLTCAESNGVEIIEGNHRIFSFLRILKFFIMVCVIYFIYHIYQKKRKKPQIAVVNGESCSTTENIQDTQVTFNDVAALEEEKMELVEIVDFLKYPERYTRLGAKIPKGVLLNGKPGTGKTLLAKAVAGEAGVSFISASGSEFINKYIGVGADNVRKLFEKAKKEAPCIVFIDEIDAIGGKREDMSCAANTERNQTIDQLLTELDGFQTRENIIIFAATNNPEILDPALTRPGRFDRIIHIGLPDVSGRKAILEVHSRNKPLFEDVSLDYIAKNTAGFSGAQLENLLNEAAIHAARHQHTAISNEDLDEAFKKITVGLKKSNNIMSEEEKRLIATHESGHAIVSLLMPTQPNIKEISIIPHNTGGGYTLNDMTDDKKYSSKTELMERLAVLMAGRVAENLIIGDISTGASADIEKATEIATKMVSVYGMSEFGPISVESINSGDYLLSEKMVSNINDKIYQTIKEAEEKATKLIHINQELVENLIQALIEKETVTGEEIQQIYSEYNLKYESSFYKRPNLSFIEFGSLWHTPRCFLGVLS